LSDDVYRQRLGQRGKQTVMEKFDLERNLKQLMAEFN
jgi:hypothetical protein